LRLVSPIFQVAKWRNTGRYKLAKKKFPRYLIMLRQQTVSSSPACLFIRINDMLR